MEKLIKKGIEVRTHRDGNVTYKPFAVYRVGMWRETKHLVRVDSTNIYFLSTRGVGATFIYERDAIEQLNACVDDYNHQLFKDASRDVMKIQTKEVK